MIRIYANSSHNSTVYYICVVTQSLDVFICYWTTRTKSDQHGQVEVSAEAHDTS